jgi:hypothetical protein
MNRTQSAIVEKETCTATAGVTTAEPLPKPYLVKGQERSGDTITRRVEEALDFELARDACRRSSNPSILAGLGRLHRRLACPLRVTA